MINLDELQALLDERPQTWSDVIRRETEIAAIFPDLVREWQRMHRELECIADMNTDSPEWYQKRARVGLGWEDDVT